MQITDSISKNLTDSDLESTVSGNSFKIYTERLFVRVNDKDESKFSRISFQNGESRGFIILIHIMTSKFDIVITVFNT